VIPVVVPKGFVELEYPLCLVVGVDLEGGRMPAGRFLHHIPLASFVA
jgi:hypothetical protein